MRANQIGFYERLHMDSPVPKKTLDVALSVLTPMQQNLLRSRFDLNGDGSVKNTWRVVGVECDCSPSQAQYFTEKIFKFFYFKAPYLVWALKKGHIDQVMADHYKQKRELPKPSAFMRLSMEERIETAGAFIRQNPFVRADELQKQFQVSPAAIRNTLKRLIARKRVHRWICKRGTDGFGEATYTGCRKNRKNPCPQRIKEAASRGRRKIVFSFLLKNVKKGVFLMKDQYNKDVPDDLVVLDLKPSELAEAEIEKIDRINWYEPNRDVHPGFQNIILVSYAALSECLYGAIDGTEPSDVGIGILKAVDYIDRPLHRLEHNSFYHA